MRFDNQQQTTDINLKDLICKLLTQWKAILLTSLVMAVLLCGTKHIRDTHNYEKEIQARQDAVEQRSIPAEERITTILDTFSYDDAASIELVIKEKEWLAEQKSYLAESLFMKTDPTEQTTLKLVYDIDAEDGDNVAALKESFETYVESSIFLESIGTYFDSETDNKYIGELINSEKDTEKVSVDSGSSFTVSVILPDDVDNVEITKAIKKEIKNYSAKLQSSFPHILHSVYEDVSIIYNYDNVVRQKDIIERITGIETSIKNSESVLTEEQRAAVNTILDIRKERDEMVGEKGAGANLPFDEDTPPGWSKKYAMLGFVLGTLLYAFAYTMILLLRGCINSADGAKQYSQIRLLGEVYFDGKATGLRKLLYSKALEKSIYQDKIDVSKQISKITDSVVAICEHIGTDKIAIISIANDLHGNNIEKINSAMTLKMREKGLEIIIVDALRDLEEKELLKFKDTIFIVNDKTKRTSLDHIMTLCKSFDITTLGMVFISEL